MKKVTEKQLYNEKETLKLENLILISKAEAYEILSEIFIKSHTYSMFNNKEVETLKKEDKNKIVMTLLRLSQNVDYVNKNGKNLRQEQIDAYNKFIDGYRNNLLQVLTLEDKLSNDNEVSVNDKIISTIKADFAKNYKEVLKKQEKYSNNKIVQKYFDLLLNLEMEKYKNEDKTKTLKLEK